MAEQHLFGVPTDVFQAISSIVGTVMSTVVATVALAFSYRQNVGWKPIVLVDSTIDLEKVLINARIEVWNRRKYPISLVAIFIWTSGVELIDTKSTKGKEHAVIITGGDSVFQYLDRKGVAPGAEFNSEIVIPCKTLEGDINPVLRIQVAYSDPYVGKERYLRVGHVLYSLEGPRSSDSHWQKIRTTDWKRMAGTFGLTIVVGISSLLMLLYTTWMWLRGLW